jgi:integrase
LRLPNRGGKETIDAATLGKLIKRLYGDRATVHGFRSSFRTWASERTNVTRDICEMALAHRVGSDVERSYARSDLFDKRRALMNAWAGYVTDSRADVVPLHA